MKCTRLQSLNLIRAVIIAGILFFQGMVPVQNIRAQGTHDAVIRPDSTQQVIRGFGAANILQWRPDMTADQIIKAFGTGEGQIGLTILRLRIPPDYNGFIHNVPTAQAASELGVTIIASPWSPPASMKTNNDLVGGRLLEEYYEDYADHLYYFVDFMESNDVPIYAVSVQNEPDVQVGYESCDWNASEMLTFVREYGSYVGARLIVPESFNFSKNLSNAILNDSEAAENVSIIGGHIYGGGLEPYPLAASKGKELWMTEHLDTDTTWSHVFATGKEIHDCMDAGMSAYVWWYIVRFYGPINEDGRVTKRGYIMSQYSKFVRPGYLKIDATERPQTQVYITAYKGESRIVIVAVNYRTSPVEQTFQINCCENESVSFTPYVTSQIKDCRMESSVNASAGTFTATLEAKSITTFVSDYISNVTGDVPTPHDVRLSQNYPNPFNPETRIVYTLPEILEIKLTVRNLKGQQITVIVDETQSAGMHQVRWDGRDANGNPVPSGVYFYRLQANDYCQVRKMLLVR